MNKIESRVLRRNGTYARRAGTRFLQFLGWQTEGQIPNLPKAVFVVAPHTSNWDAIIGLAAVLSMDMEASWLAKKSLFVGPLEKILKKVGAIPVDRGNPEGITEQVIDICRHRSQFLLGISPEGTRKPISPWKSGCCRIAAAAQIPLVPVALDYSCKKIRIFHHWQPDGDIEANMIRLERCFSAEMAKRPKNFQAHTASNRYE